MAVTTLRCPACGELTPHKTDGVQREEPTTGRKYQAMKCCECGTSTTVYTGEQGEEFQENVDLPDDTDLSCLEDETES